MYPRLALTSLCTQGWPKIPNPPIYSPSLRVAGITTTLRIKDSTMYILDKVSTNWCTAPARNYLSCSLKLAIQTLSWGWGMTSDCLHNSLSFVLLTWGFFICCKSAPLIILRSFRKRGKIDTTKMMWSLAIIITDTPSCRAAGDRPQGQPPALLWKGEDRLRSPT